MRTPRALLCFALLCFALLCCGVGVTSVAADPPNRSEIAFASPIGSSEIAGALAGRGVLVGDSPVGSELASPAGEVVWVVTRDAVDPHGFRHVFYRQQLKPSKELAARLPAKYGDEGIPLPDSSLGMHYANDGTLLLAVGHQFTTSALASWPSITTPVQAAYAGLAAVAAAGSYEPFDPSALSEAARGNWESSAELVVVSSPTGDALSLAWRVPVPAADGLGRIPVIDAGDGAILFFQEVVAGSSCTPDQNTPVNGIAYPQWSGAVTRTVPATSLNTAQPPYYYEAHWPLSSPYNPSMQVFLGGQGSSCSWSDGASFDLIRVQRASGAPAYGDPSGFPAQREAGAALYYMRKTFELTNSLGWPGYQGTLSAESRVRVQDTSEGYRGGGYFWYGPGGPVDLVGFGLTPDPVYGQCQVPSPAHACPPPTACMDLVAHEWGHGIAKYSAQFTTYQGNSVSGQMIEGFSDVIGHMVSRSNQGDTPAVNWTLFEDCIPPQTTNPPVPCRPYHQRRADQFVSDPPLCFYKGAGVSIGCPGGGPTTCPYVLQGGVPTNVMENHQAGHMLSVAFYLLADGGTTHKNPACVPNPSLAICSVVVPQLGLTKAKRIFFDTLVWWMGDTTTWEQLPLFAVSAAFAAYNTCPRGNASAEQNATAKALGAIGYPTSARMQCP